jgi:hypothetical protein
MNSVRSPTVREGYFIEGSFLTVGLLILESCPARSRPNASRTTLEKNRFLERDIKTSVLAATLSQKVTEERKATAPCSRAERGALSLAPRLQPGGQVQQNNFLNRFQWLLPIILPAETVRNGF